MAHLSDFLDLAVLARMEAEGMISARPHNQLPLIIRNYTPRAQHTPGSWNTETMACRGLITTTDGAVVARPFPKFFNLEEHPRSDIVFSKPFRATEKLDGSLGILYPGADGWAVATRGSFHSQQAAWATDWLRSTYPDFQAPVGVTLLFEIIYRQNRIVIDYGHWGGLVLLAAIDNETGADVDLPDDWPGTTVQHHDAAGLKPRDIAATLGIDDGNHEGFVLVFDHPRGRTTRVKCKLDEYKRLHRILTGVSSKTIWECLRDGSPLNDVLDRVPDEFIGWVQSTVSELQGQFDDLEGAARSEFNELLALRQAGLLGVDRKSFAERAIKSPHRALLFALLDDHPIAPMIWRQLEPTHQRPFKEESDA